MRDQNIGSLPVGEENGQLIGMVTDRDIVVGAVAEDVLPSNTAVRGYALPSTTLSSSKQ